MSVRVRLAPSPTGMPHLGTAYIALFNFCFAKKWGGKLALRIEDTDRERSHRHLEQDIMDSLKWLGLNWDEGPDVGGDFGPYRQSERSSIYQQHAHQLVAEGKAFICYRTPEELQQLRTELAVGGRTAALKQSHLAISAQKQARRKANADSYVIRMVVPETGSCLIKDGLRGEIKVDWATVDAQVLLKSDGLPTYHLANVVDDHLMAITHVIRGEEWINSAPKHQLLYEYLNWEMPALYHLPLLRALDKSKLSKRNNPVSINYYRAMGYLPQALINYLARMGWSMPDGSEKFSLQQMIEAFDIDTISLGGPVFDIDKLNWLNGCWLREEGDDKKFIQILQNWRFNDQYLQKLVPLLRPRMEKMSDFIQLALPFFEGLPLVHQDQFAELDLTTGTQLQILQYSSWVLDSQIQWQAKALYQRLGSLATAMNIKLRIFLGPLFIAISGSRVAPPLFDTMAIIGADLSRARLSQAINCLGGLSKRQLKQMQADYQKLQLVGDF